jgi:hypothetical protein
MIVGSIDQSVTLGIVIFAVGIIVGFCSVVAVDWYVRSRMADEYRRWVDAGRPERRRGDRRE